MSYDPAIKRIKRKYGIKGYGLYNLILEYISSQLEKHSPIPDLKETAADIADEWGEDIRNVEEMMREMVDQDLFCIDIETGRIVCLKIIKYLDEYLRKVPEIKSAVEKWKLEQVQLLKGNIDSPTKSDKIRQSPTKSDNVPLEYNRIEQNRIEKKKIKKNKYLDFVFLSDDEFNKLKDKLSIKVANDYIERLNNYIGSTGKKYKSHYYTILTWFRKNNTSTSKEISAPSFPPCPKCGEPMIDPTKCICEIKEDWEREGDGSYILREFVEQIEAKNE